MNIEGDVWTPVDDNDEGEARTGEILVETAGDEEIVILFRVDGEIVASIAIDRFGAGALTGQLMHSASEAVKA